MSKQMALRFVNADDTLLFMAAAERYVAANTATQDSARAVVDRVTWLVPEASACIHTNRTEDKEMSKRKQYEDDTDIKDSIVFVAMPIVAWAMLMGLVVVMVWITG